MTPDEARTMVEDCADNGSMSKWAMNFIVSFTDKLDRGVPLSEREEEILIEIHDGIFK